MPNHPIWYRNLEARPECDLKVGAKAVSARARVAEGEEREKLWAKVDKRAKGLYGEDVSLPSPDQFLGETPAEFISNLRNWLEGNTKAEVKEGKEKKTLFNSLFGR